MGRSLEATRSALPCGSGDSPPGGDLMQQGLGWMGLDPDRSRVELAPCGETVRHPCEWAAHRVQFPH